MQLLGHVPAMSAAEVRAVIANAKSAAQTWRSSSFSQRRRLLRILLKFIIDHQDTICRVSARDSGKAKLDAILGEVVVTCEKIHWLCREGERWLRPEQRSAGRMSFYKAPRVEYHPVGVVGAIVPWNYPFHNVLNPLTAAVFAGNALVIKVSEYASWSTGYYGRAIQAALAAAGAPQHLVQFVTGYGEAGQALVTGGVDKLIFVGSTAVGRKVMAAAAETLTPVVLELGGKDAFIVCQDADISQVVQVACKAAFLNCGQNCAGGERFFVHKQVHEDYCRQVVEVVRRMRQGPALGPQVVDCGAMCMPGLAEKVQGLVDDAVARGATLLAGGKLPEGMAGQFYPPTVLSGVKPGMRIWEEEVFGPVMSIISWAEDDEVVALANNCAFGLGSNVFSGSQARARSLCARMEAGMTSINDFATTYMCQSLPFGGVKHSGFDRFAGIEGLRGLCVPKAVSEDRLPWLMKSSLPPPWQYPVQDIAFDFGTALVTMFYGPGLLYQIKGLLRLAACFLAPGLLKKAKKD
ncbi:Aldehyde/histidinol dehydrogenase [Haematococcus lacustris]